MCVCVCVRVCVRVACKEGITNKHPKSDLTKDEIDLSNFVVKKKKEKEKSKKLNKNLTHTLIIATNQPRGVACFCGR